MLPKLLFLAAIACSSVAAQQGVLSNGNSQFPSCAASCPLLNQASAACGGADSDDQTVWICFCQSSYLTGLRNSGEDICSSTCSAASDNQQIVTWYKSNCGTDNGASEHSAAAPTSTAASTSTASSSKLVPTSKPTQTSTANPGAVTGSSNSISSDDGGPDNPNNSEGDWWPTHWKYVVMIIVIFVGLGLVAIGGALLRRHLLRRRDTVHGRFNTGITSQTLPSHRNPLAPPSASSLHAQPTQSPARTRDAFMPYGFAYARSESRNVARAAEGNARGSPLAQNPLVNEKEAGVGRGKKSRSQRRVLVRERSSNLSPRVSDIEDEKRKEYR